MISVFLMHKIGSKNPEIVLQNIQSFALIISILHIKINAVFVFFTSQPFIEFISIHKFMVALRLHPRHYVIVDTR